MLTWELKGDNDYNLAKPLIYCLLSVTLLTLSVEYFIDLQLSDVDIEALQEFRIELHRRDFIYKRNFHITEIDPVLTVQVSPCNYIAESLYEGTTKSEY